MDVRKKTHGWGQLGITIYKRAIQIKILKEGTKNYIGKRQNFSITIDWQYCAKNAIYSHSCITIPCTKRTFSGSLPCLRGLTSREQGLQRTVREFRGENDQSHFPSPGDSLHPAVSGNIIQPPCPLIEKHLANKEQSLGRRTKTSFTEQRVVKWQETDHSEQKMWILAGTSLSTYSTCSAGPYITFPSDC